MAFANDTRVFVNPNDEKPIYDLVVGDVVYAADENNPSDWGQQVIQFSSGTGDGGQQAVMVHLIYQQQDSQNIIIVTRDQPFLTSAKQIKQADQLVPGVDELLSVNGESIQILSINMGTYRGGVHDIAVTTSFDSPGYWIVANNLVCGDYRIQLGQ